MHSTIALVLSSLSLVISTALGILNYRLSQGPKIRVRLDQALWAKPDQEIESLLIVARIRITNRSAHAITVRKLLLATPDSNLPFPVFVGPDLPTTILPHVQETWLAESGVVENRMREPESLKKIRAVVITSAGRNFRSVWTQLGGRIIGGYEGEMETLEGL